MTCPPSKRGPFVRIKDFALLRVKASFKVFGSLLSIGVKELFVIGFASFAGVAVFVAGDIFDPLEAGGITAQVETAPNILIEIRDIVQEIEERDFPPGPPGGLPAEFLAQIDGIETKVDCLAAVLNGVETSC